MVDGNVVGWGGEEGRKICNFTFWLIFLILFSNRALQCLMSRIFSLTPSHCKMDARGRICPKDHSNKVNEGWGRA